MEKFIKPTLENLKKHYEKYNYDMAYPIQCIEKYIDKDKDIFYVLKGSKKALVFKENSILISSAQVVKEKEEEIKVYGIDKIYFRDIKKVNLKEFGAHGKVLGGKIQLTLSFDGYEDIMLDSFKDSGETVNGQEMLEEDFSKLIVDIFNRLNKM